MDDQGTHTTSHTPTAFLLHSRHRHDNTPSTAHTASSSTPDTAVRPRSPPSHQAFALELSDADAAAHFSDLIHKSLATRTTQVNNAVHILAH